MEGMERSPARGRPHDGQRTRAPGHLRRDDDGGDTTGHGHGRAARGLGAGGGGLLVARDGPRAGPAAAGDGGSPGGPAGVEGGRPRRRGIRRRGRHGLARQPGAPPRRPRDCRPAATGRRRGSDGPRPTWSGPTRGPGPRSGRRAGRRWRPPGPGSAGSGPGPAPRRWSTRTTSWAPPRPSLRGARLSWERTSRLGSRGFSTAARSTTAGLGLDRLRERAGAAGARLRLLRAGSRAEEVAEAEAELARAQAEDDLLRAGTRREDLAAARERVAEARAAAPRGRGRPAPRRSWPRRERAVVEVARRPAGRPGRAQPAVARVLRADDLWVKVLRPRDRARPAQARAGGRGDGRLAPGPAVPRAGRRRSPRPASSRPRNVQSVDERQAPGLRRQGPRRRPARRVQVGHGGRGRRAAAMGRPYAIPTGARP